MGLRLSFLDEEAYRDNLHLHHKREKVPFQGMNYAAYLLSKWTRVELAAENGCWELTERFVDGRGNYAKLDSHRERELEIVAADSLELISATEEELERTAANLGLKYDRLTIEGI